MAQAVDRDRLGAWLLKCNPAAWDLRGFLATGERRLTSWSVSPGYRSAMMAPPDRVLFWVSGTGRQSFPRGVWGLGQVTAEAESWVEESHGFWRDPADRHGIRARVLVDIALLDDPVTDAELRSAGVGDLEVTSLSGRNRVFGTRVGRGEPPSEALAAMAAAGQTVEGVPAARLARELAADRSAALPLLAAVNAILDGRPDPAGLLAGAVLPR